MTVRQNRPWRQGRSFKIRRSGGAAAWNTRRAVDPPSLPRLFNWNRFNAKRRSALSRGHAQKIGAQLQAESRELLARTEAAAATPPPDGLNIPEGTCGATSA